MAGIFRKLAHYFSRQPEAAASAEERRQLVQARYHAFRLLLAANNNALQLMTHMESVLSDTQCFGMSFVRAHATAVCVNVFAIIKHLNDLSGNRYKQLESVFARIREKIEEILAQKSMPPIQELVLPLTAADRESADGIGAKMANLAEIKNRLPGLLAPEGFVITTAAYELFLSHNNLQEEINRRLQAAEVEEVEQLSRLSSEIQMLIINAEIPPALKAAVDRAYDELEAMVGKGVRLALRSSATSEDAVATSFAGQYRSELNVSRENLYTVYKEIIASKYAVTALSYRLHKGLRDEDVAMCVGCMPMVTAVAGGVMYSRNPTDIRSDAVFINAVHGLAKAVVDGSVTPDLYVVPRKEPLSISRKEIREKTHKVECLSGGGLILTPNPAAQDPALTEGQILELARIALRLEEHFGVPQDVEWSIDEKGRVVILQSRPLQQMELPGESRVTSAIGAEVILKGGDTASRGVAAGPVYLVASNLDLLKFPKGAVLVTAFPSPKWAPLLPRAAAVVTDRGGITGHLGNVAREFKIPALFNTGEATRRLKTGQVITVDADGCTIYEGRVEELLGLPQKKGNPLVGTPVYETLREVLRHINPLNLTDPDAPDFRAENCRTLHDITRFAHEMSLREMFQVDQGLVSPEHAIKQLVVGVPIQWWVLNLEDGFKKERPGREVYLDDIASEPMLALWEGITAVPWEGPPPVDTKGFLSTMLSSATHPELAAEGGGVFGNRNYFMISRYFCHLTSRLGFHFSTVEALVSEATHDNYIRFTFKGGAADPTRKGLRTKFIGEILKRYHFKVDVKEDSLFACLEGETKDYMLSRLKILGYLTIHTRQLDMIMLDEGQRQAYLEKILSDIDNVLLQTNSK